MRLIREQYEAIDGGGILYDAALIRKAEPQWFSRSYWIQRDALTEVAGGRGAVCFLQAQSGRWVWRHYRRGGLAAKILDDRYLWTGEPRTRSFAEWRLLAELRRLDLPVPAPVAARYVRAGLLYRADLITQEVPDSRTLAQAMANAVSEAQWAAVGRVIARFHEHGVHHADLNANNILFGAGGMVHVLDFDRGRIRPRGSWENDVLARLKRSLEKVSRLHGDAVFNERDWRALLDGYEGGEKGIGDRG